MQSILSILESDKSQLKLQSSLTSLTDISLSQMWNGKGGAESAGGEAVTKQGIA